jgi:hypothetical protein
MRRRMAAGLAAAVVLASSGTSASAARSSTAVAGDSAEAIVITDQASDQILVLASDKQSWDTATVAWRWRPTVENGLGDLVDNWNNPSEAKLRHRGDQAYLLTTDSKGLAAVVAYPQGNQIYWAADVGGPANAHSIELLPDGNVAVAASTGG